MMKISLIALIELYVVLIMCGCAAAYQHTETGLPIEYWCTPLNPDELKEHVPFIFNDSGVYAIRPRISWYMPDDYHQIIKDSFGLSIEQVNYNETDDCIKLFKLYNIVFVQSVSPGQMNTYEQGFRHICNETEYLNESELQDVLKLCNNTLQRGQDLLNQSSMQYNKGKDEECIKTFYDFVKIDQFTDMILQMRLYTYSILCTKSPSLPGFDRRAEQDAEAFSNNFNYKDDVSFCVKKIAYDMIDVNERTAYQEWINTSGIKIDPGKYESTKITVPLGNCTTAFEIRTVGEMNITKAIVAPAVGSGKDYHIETFRVDNFQMDRDPARLKISIAQYTGPSKYKPTTPFDGYDAVNKKGYKTYSPEDIQIDGHTARLDESYNIKHDNYPNRYAVTYALDANTFVMIETYSINYEKDVSLLFETFHIEKRG